MSLTNAKLGQYIRRLELRNEDLTYGIDDVRGISNNKEIQPTKADVTGRSFKRFQIVSQNNFVFNRRTTRMGEKIGLGYNNTSHNFIVTEDYVVFEVSDTKDLLSDYLYLFFQRAEFDRYARWDSWGSATEFFNWEEMCNVPITFPSIEIQQKYVDIYTAMLRNQHSYERGLKDLKLTCDGYIEQLKYSAIRMPMLELLEEVDVRNYDNVVTDVQGININKEFMPSIAGLSSTDLSRYKVISKGQFAYSAMQTGRDKCIRIALYPKSESAVISPAYSVLQTKTKKALAEWIMMWFSRYESDRYGWFKSDSSVRASLELSTFSEILIPIPDIAIQQSIVDIYTVYQQRKEINERLKRQIKDICPILVKGALEEGAKL